MQIVSKQFRHYEKGKVGLSGLTDALLVLYLKKIYIENNRNILVLTNSLFEANKVHQLLSKEVEDTLLFPMDDFLTDEALAISPDLKVSRLETINSLVSSNKNRIIVTHLMGYLRYLPEKNVWKNSIIKLAKGSTIKKSKLISDLYNIGYENETIVTRTGEMGTRGYIVDLFPIKESNPIRIEFWGDEIDSIRYFDLDTQLSIKEINEIDIYPFEEFIADVTDKEMRKQKYLPNYANVSNISEYIDNPLVVYIDYNQIKNAYLMLREEIFNYHTEHKDSIKTNYMHNFENMVNKDEIYVMNVDNILSDIKLDYVDKYDSRMIQNYNSNVEEVNKDLETYLVLGKTVIICLRSNIQIESLTSLLNHKYLLTNENDIHEGKINIIEKDIVNGFIFNDLVVISDKDLFKKIETKAVYKSQFKYGTKIKDITKLSIGDYVVHQIHGIGIYCGIETLIKNGVKKDYLQIKYKGNDKLYIPVEKIDLIWKYSTNEGLTPTLHQLGGTEWQKTKQRIKNRLHDIAGKLLKTAAERQATRGFAFSPDNEEQLRFENEFVYEPTKDQLIAARQIKSDMECASPMDRLLCGDVGYGKTEVAFRAIFKAIQDNKQVAFLCPTTILSNQHYENAIDRFKNFAVNVALLNRFSTPKEVREITKGLAIGTIDMVIGTHRLLSKDVRFKDLGLLVVDEEQRFGVTHKELIKEYKSSIDVLTLSATPIPRTLQISMLGLKNLSLIETPPMNRFPIQTYVLEYNDYIIKDAIYKELSRHGQVFLLYNKVVDIEDKANEIKRLIPDARITFAHGQMPKQKIEDRMLKFIDGEYDILICTTIIETGIDIPNVNTLIIIDADHFGLSQLYQIRGRVGRSNRIAYAYLMYKKNKVLNEFAVKRLNVIKEFTALGSGFSIALRDLSIRGAGDILGSEQAGFIDSIGIELYLKMLNEEVLKLKGNTILEEESVDQVDEKPLLDVETHIADEYVKEDDLKIEIHRKINQINSLESLNNVKMEIEDRFGKISESMEIYMYEEWFEKIAKEKGIEKVVQTKLNIELVFLKEVSNTLKINDLFVTATKISNAFRLYYKEHRIRVVLDINKLDRHWLYYVVEFVSKMQISIF
jgi:transcription-repair coupling factor (superfamily II helicase)